MKGDRSLTTNSQFSTSNSQLPKGYKQTEVGAIPDDWEVKPLKKISPSLSVGLVINPSSYFDKNCSIPMLVGSHVDENQINWESANRISEFSNNALPASRLSVGDLVTVRVGDPGITAVIPPELDGCNCASMMIVRKHSSFDSCWLCYVMNSKIGRSQIEHVQYGTAQKQFNISDAINFLYPVPPIAEQNLIARALSDTDALIESLEQLLAKKRQIKQGAMQELLRSKDTWDKEEIRNILTLIMDYRGRTPKKLGMEWGGGDIRALSAGNVKRGWIDFEAEAYFASEALYQKWMTQGVTKENDILVTTEAPLGNIAIIPDSKKYILSQRVISLRTDPQIINSKYLYHYISSEIFQELLKKDSSGSTATGIQRLKLEKILIAFPSLAEQQAIATILSDMDLEIGAIETKLTKARQLKQGMMHELLTGKIRLIDKGNT